MCVYDMKCEIQELDDLEFGCGNHLYLPESLLRNYSIGQYLHVHFLFDRSGEREMDGNMIEGEKKYQENENQDNMPEEIILCKVFGFCHHSQNYCVLRSTHEVFSSWRNHHHHLFLKTICDITLFPYEMSTFYSLPVARTIILRLHRPRDRSHNGADLQIHSNEIRNHYQMIHERLKKNLNNQVIHLQNSISLPLVMFATNEPQDPQQPEGRKKEPLHFQLQCIYDRYDSKNIQHQSMKKSALQYFRVAATTNISIDRHWNPRETTLNRFNFRIYQYFRYFIRNESFVQTLHGYLASLLNITSMKQLSAASASSHLSLSSLLLVGPSGSGKTCLLKQEIESFLPENFISFIRISLGTLQPYSDEILIQTLNSALVRQPCVIFLDHIEYLTPNEKNISDREISSYANMTSVRVSSYTLFSTSLMSLI
jgi:hypothetical protein